MATINNPSILKDSLTRMKELLASGITDPISASRSSDSRFVMSTFPERKAEYPHITVTTNHGPTERMGMRSEIMNVPVQFTIQVWAEKMSDKDQLAGSVMNVLRKNQYGTDSTTGTGLSVEGLYDMNINTTRDIDEIGKKGLHRKVIEGEFNFMAGD